MQADLHHDDDEIDDEKDEIPPEPDVQEIVTQDIVEPTDDISGVNVKFDLRRRLADGRGYAQLGVAVFARDERPGPTEIVTPSYATVDLGAGWRLSKSVELRATVRNLFDSAYPASPDRRAVLEPGINAVIAVVGEF